MKPRKTKPARTEPSAGAGMLPPASPDSDPIVPWLHLEPSTRMKLICVSSTWLGAQTHWAEGRMKIHTTPTCRWCKAGGPLRFYFWLHLCAGNFARQYVVQLSGGNMGTLVRARDLYSSLRGCQVEVTRRGKAANSPTVIAFLTPPYDNPELPPEFDLRAKLQHATDWNDKGLSDHDKPKETDA